MELEAQGALEVHDALDVPVVHKVQDAKHVLAVLDGQKARVVVVLLKVAEAIEVLDTREVHRQQDTLLRQAQAAPERLRRER
jgi:hypothetical protein